MMKRLQITVGLVLAVFLYAGSDRAAVGALLDRGGGLVYDDAADVTWLQDANYSQTTGYDADGRMTAYAAAAWAEGLVFQGYGDWRLPDAHGLDGRDPFYGWNQDMNEMGRLYYDELGNQATMDVYDLSGLDHSGPFINLQPFRYWSGTPYFMTPELTWYFNFGSGYQWDGYSLGEGYAWAVRDGDSLPVPLPGSLFLLATSLGGAAAVKGIRLMLRSPIARTGLKVETPRLGESWR